MAIGLQAQLREAAGSCQFVSNPQTARCSITTGSSMNFASDNWAGAHPAVAAALSAQAAGFAAAYGASELDRKVALRLSELFEREVAVYFVATGTAANALSMTALARPGGVAFTHR